MSGMQCAGVRPWDAVPSCKTYPCQKDFLSNALHLPKENRLLEGSQDSPVCPAGKSNVQIYKCGALVELNLQQRTEVLGEKPVPIPLGPQQISQRLGLEPEAPQAEAETLHDPLNHPSFSLPKRKYFPIQCCPISEYCFCFGRFPV
jgi:hypothetical protein